MNIPLRASITFRSGLSIFELILLLAVSSANLFFVAEAANDQTTPAAPCCAITAIDLRTGIVSGKVHETGQAFSFELLDKRATSSLRIDQSLYANFKTKQVSLDGKRVAGTIVSGPTPAGPQHPAPASAGPLVRPTTGSPSASTSVPSTPAPALPVATFVKGQRQGPPPNYGSIVPAPKCLGGTEAPDLRISELKFNSTRHVTYTVTNCGRASTSLPFVVDLYINGVRGDTVEHQVLPGQSQQTVTSQLAQDHHCDRAVLLAIADPQHIVPETNTTNNQMSVDLTPPCPDLQVEEIKQHWVDANTRYQAEIKVGNHGDGPSELTVVAQVSQDAEPFGNPTPEEYDIPPLAPGHSFIFVCDGKHLVTTTTNVDVMVDIYKQIFESSTNNKHVNKTLGPH